MVELAVNVMAIAVPAIAAAVIALAVLNTSRPVDIGAGSLLITSGSLVLYIVVSSGVWLFGVLTTILALSSLTACVWLNTRYLASVDAFDSVPGTPGAGFYSKFLRRPFITGLAIMLAALLPLSFWSASFVPPMFGWDSIDFWSELAILISEQTWGGGLSDVSTIPPHRHPPLIGALLAFSVRPSGLSPFELGPKLVWLFAWLSVAFSAAGASYALSHSRLGACLAFLLVVTTPLLANHAYVFGYAELWTCAILTGSVGLVSVGIKKASLIFTVFGVGMSFLLIGLKNTGWIYCGCIIVAWIYVVNKRAFFCLVIAALCGIFTAWLYFLREGQLVFKVLGSDYGLVDMHPFLGVRFAGYKMILKPYPFIRIVSNNGMAFFADMSYSVLLVIGALTSLSIFRIRSNDNIFQPALFLMLTGVFLFVAFSVPQFIVSYSMTYAEYGHNTGLSRFFLSLSPLTAMCLSSVVSQIEQRKNPGN